MMKPCAVVALAGLLRARSRRLPMPMRIEVGRARRPQCGEGLAQGHPHEFNEPVEIKFSGIELTDASGKTIERARRAWPQ